VTRIRVLVVDDSVVIRRLVSDVLAADPDIEVVGTASNGRLALAKLDLLSPDLVTMDIEMPEVDGIEAVRRMRAAGSRLPVIMFSTLTEHGAMATLDALAAGASDYVTKPANVGSVGASMEQVRAQLVPRIKALVPRLGGGSVAKPAKAPVVSRPVVPPVARRPRTEPFRVLAVGCSTGGPEALAKLLSTLPADLSVPVVVVQHMPPVFTRQFAARLDRTLPFCVVESAGGEALQPGHVYVAPGGHHLEVVSIKGVFLTRLTQAPPENFCRPAVDVLFRSAAATYGPGVLAAVLTGMGSDGRHGAESVVAAGGSVLVQDEATSVVWGMPGSVVQAGAAEEVLPLLELGAALWRRISASRRPSALVATGGAS
jgi:two-component system chemotaxis response regulator CheB